MQITLRQFTRLSIENALQWYVETGEKSLSTLGAHFIIEYRLHILRWDHIASMFDPKEIKQ